MHCAFYCLVLLYGFPHTAGLCLYAWWDPAFFVVPENTDFSFNDSLVSLPLIIFISLNVYSQRHTNTLISVFAVLHISR